MVAGLVSPEAIFPLLERRRELEDLNRLPEAFDGAADVSDLKLKAAELIIPFRAGRVNRKKLIEPGPRLFRPALRRVIFGEPEGRRAVTEPGVHLERF